MAAGAAVLKRLLGDDERRRRAEGWENRLVGALKEAGGMTGEAPMPARSLDTDSADPTRDLVAVEATFDAGMVAPDLLTAIHAHAGALIADDTARLAAQIAEGARAAVLDTYARGGPGQAYAVVAQAKVGAHRLIKLRLEGPRGPWLLVQQWRRLDGQWRVVEAELVSGSGA